MTLRCALLVALALAVCSCGIVPLPCAHSMRARAAGKYPEPPDGPPPEGYRGNLNQQEKAAFHAFQVYARSCNQGCVNDKDQAYCAEMALLDFAWSRSVRKSKRDLVAACSRGVRVACQWVAKHRKEIAHWDRVDARLDRTSDQYWLRKAAERRATAVAQRRADASSPVPAFVEDLKKSLLDQGGFTLVSDARYGLESGGTAFAVHVKPDVQHTITLVGRAATTFTATLVRPGADTLQFTRETDVPPGLFVMSLSLMPGDTEGPVQVVVNASGTDRGDVRVVQLQRPAP